MCDPLPLSQDGPWDLGETMKMGMTTLCDVPPYAVMIKFAYFRDKLGVAENTSLAEREC